METPEQILDEVAVLNMKNVQQMVCTKELVIKAMRLYAKAYYEREMQEHKEVIEANCFVIKKIICWHKLGYGDLNKNPVKYWRKLPASPKERLLRLLRKY